MALVKLEKKIYIQIFYPIDPTKGEQFQFVVREVYSKDPLLYKSDLNMVGFRFIDVKEYVFENGEKFPWPKVEYSNIFYYGKRLQGDEMNRLGHLASFFKERADSVIKCDNGYIMYNLDESSITIDEYKKSLGKQYTLKRK